jgi:hypothetical protein
MSRRETYRTTLTYALAIAGSEARLAELLKIKVPMLVNWMVGVEPVPDDVFLKAVDVVLTATAEDVKQSRDRLNKLKRFGKLP